MRTLIVILFLGSTAFAQELLAPADDQEHGRQIGDGKLERVDLSLISGFENDDLHAALRTFLLGCKVRSSMLGQIESVAGSQINLQGVCQEAAKIAKQDARRFFLESFSAFRIRLPVGRKRGFLTGYFEPCLHGSLNRTEVFSTPVLARPDDLVSFIPGQQPAGLSSVQAARLIDGYYEPYPDRASIEDGAIAGHTRPILWLKDSVDLLVVQVQGSGRVILPDGRSIKLLYDGKNGRPFTAVAKLIVDGGYLPLEGLTLEHWTSWLRAHPDLGYELMRRNASYVFFRVEDDQNTDVGPLGASGAPLTAGRSLAVDATLWRYGLPFWLEGSIPGVTSSGGRMVIAQDTGTAINGVARGDLYIGSGSDAGRIAGDLRNEIEFIVLLPKSTP